MSQRSLEIPESSTVAIADVASGLRRDGHDVVDMSAGRAAEATPAIVCQAAIDAIESGFTHQTEARGRPEYLAAIAAKLESDNGLSLDATSNVIATLGCKQGLVLSLLAAIDPGDEVIIEDPCFVSYAPTIRLLGGIPVAVATRPENRFCWTEADLDAAITGRTRAILFCSPHNPTGTVHSMNDLAVIANAAKQYDLTVIADEIYEAVAWEGRRHVPIYSLPDMQTRTIGLMGMTKSYSMGGWRIGYAYADAEFISSMTKLQQHLMTCASSFAQIGATKALQPDVTKDMGPLWSEWEQRCMFVANALNTHPNLVVREPEGSFYAWVDISATGLASEAFCDRLIREKMVATVPGVAFGKSCDNFVRITCVRSREEINEGIHRILELVDSL